MVCLANIVLFCTAIQKMYYKEVQFFSILPQEYYLVTKTSTFFEYYTLKSQMIQISYMYQQLYFPCTIFQSFSTLQFCSVMQCCKQKKSHPTPLEI